VWNSITAAFSAAGQAISNAVGQAVGWLTARWNEGMAFLGSLPGRILGIFAAAGSWLINAGMNIITGLVNGIASLIGNVASAAGNAGRSAINAFAGAGSWLVGAGMDLLRGLGNGIMRMGGWVYNQVIGWAKGLLNGIKSFFGIGSPSKVFDDYGGWLMEGLQNGIDDSATLAIRAAEEAAQGVLGIMSGTLDTGTMDAIIGNSLSDASLAALVGTAPIAGGTVGTAAATGAGTMVPSSAPAAMSTGAASIGPQVNFELNTYNPVAERASDSEARKIRAAAAVGSF
jgi:phage-related protein